MKLTTLIFIASMLPNLLPENHKTLTYSGENVSYKEIFAEIKSQADVVVFYDVDLMRDIKPITIDVKNSTVEETLNAMFANQLLTWTMESKTVTIFKRKISHFAGRP